MSGALKLFGSFMTAEAQRKAGSQQQDAYNLQAQIEKDKGKVAENNERAKLQQLLASQRALYAKAGVDMASGSPLAVMAFTAQEGEKDALNIRVDAQNESSMLKYYGRQAKAAGKMQGRMTMLNGLIEAASSAEKAFGAAK